MKKSQPSVQRQPLPIIPSLEHLRKQAKKKVRENPSLKLAAAQHQIAKEYGFKNWAELAQEVTAREGGNGSEAALLAAIRQENLAEIVRLLERWPKLLEIDLWPVAIYETKSVAVTKLLLDRGLDPNRCSAPRLPLHLAVYQVLPDIVQTLLKAGADATFLNPLGEHPLDLLDAYEPKPVGDPGTGRIRDLLVQAGARADFMVNVRMGDLPALQKLLADGISIAPSALHAAARSGRAEVAKLLLQHGANPDELNEKKNTPLWFAAQSPAKPASNRIEVMKLLLEAGADLNRRCEDGSTALHFAAWRGPAEVVEFLLSHGARNWIADNEGKLPVDYARKSNVAQDKETIVELFSSPRIEDSIFREAVEAITVGNLIRLKRLLKEHPGLAHARAEEKGEYAGSYFFRPSLLEFIPENPVRTGKLPRNIGKLAQAIIDAGVPQVAIDKTLGLAASGRVPRECGVQTELLELLVRHGADATGGLDAAISQGEWAAAETLLRLGARLGLKAAAGLGRSKPLEELLASSSGKEELVQAANAAIRGGHVVCVKLLLDAGLSVNTPVPDHPYSPTLLHQAALFGQAEIIELLVTQGADLAAKDTQFHGTPADWAHHAGHATLSVRLRSKEKSQSKK